MAAIIWTNVTDAASPNDAAVLTAVDTSAQNMILAVVNTAIDIRLFALGESDPRLFMARVLLAAHYAMLMAYGATGPGGPLIMEEAGGLQRQYAFMTGGDPLYDSTSYGRAYRLLIRPMTGGCVL